MINRTAVMVRPAELYISWAATVVDSELDPMELSEATVYLIPEVESIEQAWEILEECYLDIFEHELSLWSTDEDGWPADRTFDLFRQWFVIDFSGEINDLCDYEIEDEDLDDDDDFGGDFGQA